MFGAPHRESVAVRNNKDENFTYWKSRISHKQLSIYYIKLRAVIGSSLMLTEHCFVALR